MEFAANFHESRAMIRIDDIHSLSDFQRGTREHIRRIKKSGRPMVLTVNGQAEIVVQDAKSYQNLLARAEEAENRENLLRGIADYHTGKARDLDEVLDQLTEKHLHRETRRGSK